MNRKRIVCATCRDAWREWSAECDRVDVEDARAGQREVCWHCDRPITVGSPMARVTFRGATRIAGGRVGAWARTARLERGAA